MIGCPFIANSSRKISGAALNSGVIATDSRVNAAALAEVGAAWVTATCPDAAHRDGGRAVDLATKAVARHDTWIAATALAHDFTLITGDERQAALPLVRVTLIPHGA